MKYEDLKKRIEKLITSPDTAQADAIELLADLEADYTTMDTLRTRAAEDAERIRTLQDTNARLFLGQVSPAEKEEPTVDESDGEEFIENFFDNLGGNENE